MCCRPFSKQLSLLCLAAATLWLAGFGNAARATQLWYDGFATGPGGYTIGALGGQTGGSGSFFTGSWVQPGGDDTLVLANSLSQAGQPIPSIGGSVGDSDLGPGACCITSRTARNFAVPWEGRTPPEGTFYIGFLASWGRGAPTDPHFRAIEMYGGGGFDDGANRNLQLGYSSFGNFDNPTNGPAGGNLQLSLDVRNSTTNAETHVQLGEHLTFGADNGDIHCVVMRFDLSNTLAADGGGDRVRVYLDPMTAVEPGTASADVSGVDILLDAMSAMDQFVFNSPSLAGRMDELRVGTAFADVANCGMVTHVPEPATLSLCGLSLIGLLAAARRKK